MTLKSSKKAYVGAPNHDKSRTRVTTEQVSGSGVPKKVFVGMSGGVDSSVSATLLKERGYDVTGVFIKVWQPDFIECVWRADREDAMRVAAHLGIRFKTLDLEKEYKERVVDYMIREYKEGRTPNPDVMCNHYVKFGGFFDWAMKEGADYVATGHYAKVTPEGVLLRSVDEDKDQTYFLWKLSKEKLKRVLFPVGSMKKSEVRQYASEHGLHVAEKSDSQGVCFIGELDMKEFLSHHLDLKPGDVLNTKGEVVGKHEGAEIYTLGQRRGFVVSKKGPEEGPHFVVSKNIKDNTITVVSEVEREKEEVPVKEVELEHVNWIAGLPPRNGKDIQVRFRHRQTLLNSRVVSQEPLRIEFEEPQRSVSPGQSLVVYDEGVCLGGGIIVHSTKV